MFSLNVWRDINSFSGHIKVVTKLPRKAEKRDSRLPFQGTVIIGKTNKLPTGIIFFYNNLFKKNVCQDMWWFAIASKWKLYWSLCVCDVSIFKCMYLICTVYWMLYMFAIDIFARVPRPWFLCSIYTIIIHIVISLHGLTLQPSLRRCKLSQSIRSALQHLYYYGISYCM